jgi:hypothetical protein
MLSAYAEAQSVEAFDMLEDSRKEAWKGSALKAHEKAALKEASDAAAKRLGI